MVTQARSSGSRLPVCWRLWPACNPKTGGDVMATVDGRKIFRSDVDKYYDNQVASAQQAPTGEQATALRLNILHQMIDDEILMRRAEKLGLLATDEEVDRKYNEIKSPFTQEEFDKRLQDKKITLADFKRDIRRSITVEKVMNKEVSSKINVTDQDITDYYNAHKGGVQPDRAAVPSGADHGDAGAQSAGPQPERQSAERSRCPQENPDDLPTVWTVATISPLWR